MKNIKHNFKITYRPLEASDLEVRTKWLQNPLVSKNLGWRVRQGTTLSEQKNWFEKYQSDESREIFVIEADGRAVGTVGLTDINPVDRNAELYLVMGEDDYRNKGIGREACEYIIQYGFESLKLHKILLIVNSYNAPAIHLYKSIGFIEEGILKEDIFFEGQYFDEIYMGIINSEEA